MIQKLTDVITVANPDYIVEFEENKMMNIKVDELEKDAKFAYIEEYVQGSYGDTKFFKQKTTQIQIYFCRFSDLHIDAIEREQIRKAIESEIVIPFMKLYNETFNAVHEWKFYTPLPRFDANEVSIMLQFNFVQSYC